MLWLWCRPAATALIQTQAWELPYAVCVALKEKKKKEYEKNIYVCITESLCYTVEINTTLSIIYTSIKILKTCILSTLNSYNVTLVTSIKLGGGGESEWQYYEYIPPLRNLLEN